MFEPKLLKETKNNKEDLFSKKYSVNIVKM